MYIPGISPRCSLSVGSGAKEVGLAGSADQVVGSVNADTGKQGQPESGTAEWLRGATQDGTSSDQSKDVLTLGWEAGEGLLGGGRWPTIQI